MKVQYDERTKKWFANHIGAQTTVMQCPECGLYYKPKLMHKCKKVKK